MDHTYRPHYMVPEGTGEVTSTLFRPLCLPYARGIKVPESERSYRLPAGVTPCGDCADIMAAMS